MTWNPKRNWRLAPSKTKGGQLRVSLPNRLVEGNHDRRRRRVDAGEIGFELRVVHRLGENRYRIRVPPPRLQVFLTLWEVHSSSYLGPRRICD